MKIITNLEPLCALVLMRMSHQQLLRVLFFSPPVETDRCSVVVNGVRCEQPSTIRIGDGSGDGYTFLCRAHAELVLASKPEDGHPTEPLGSEGAAQQEDEEQEDFSTCDDASISLDFARLGEGLLPRADVYRLSNHISTCDTCKQLFAVMVCEERRAKALDNFEGCKDICG